MVAFLPFYPGEERLDQAVGVSPCLLGAVLQSLIVGEGSDMLNLIPFSTGDGQEGPSLPQAMFIGVG